MIRLDADGLLSELMTSAPRFAAHLQNLCAQMRTHAREADELGDVPAEFWQAVNVRDLNLSHVPREFGGSDTIDSVLRRALVAEQLGRADPGLAFALPGPGLSRTPILALGTAAQRSLLFGRFLSDEPTWGAFAVSEPGVGSDATAVRTRVTDGGDCWIIEGDKCFIGSGARATYVVVFASIDPSRGRFGIRALVVDRGTPGFTATPMPEMLGVRAAQVSHLAFRDCRVPKENMLGFDGAFPASDALTGAQRSWDFMRPLLSGVIVGASVRMIEDLELLLRSEMRWTPRSRRSCVEALTELNRKCLAARLMVHRAASRYDRGLTMSKEACIAKALAANVAMETADVVMGLAGMGALRGGSLFEKWYRDAKAFDILEGTGDMQRLMITKIHSMREARPFGEALAAARKERSARASRVGMQAG